MSQIANRKLSRATTIGGLSVNLNHLKSSESSSESGNPSSIEQLNEPDTFPMKGLCNFTQDDLALVCVKKPKLDDE